MFLSISLRRKKLNLGIPSKFTSVYINFRRILLCYIFIFLEILATKSVFFYELLMRFRIPTVSKEMEMANISSDDKILLIGCGPFPSTPIILAEKNGNIVHCIDNNQWIIQFAKSYIQKKGLHDLITIEYGNGSNYPVNNFDVIFIAINVWPIKNVLTHVLKNMRDNTRIICKGMNDDINFIMKINELTEYGLLTNSKKIPLIDLFNFPMTQSFLLKKRDIEGSQ